MIKAIVTDIEGTTSSLSFVKEVLFPYARAHIGEFIRAHQIDPEVKRLMEDARTAAGKPLATEDLIMQLIRWIDDDQKITPLKSLQGLIWEHGYRKGDFKGHIYSDAAQALKTWKQLGIALYVYSSGSVYAQKLLFGHTEFGDLTSLFSGYFDTHIGGKKERESYTQIASQIELAPAHILFLSDIAEELDAAQAAGFKTCCLDREKTGLELTGHPTVQDFTEITL
ncbi:MAG: acireductone synthase [Gammaproteobacteria bacterium]